jgi:DNA-binding CsgD family transcriptional regulator
MLAHDDETLVDAVYEAAIIPELWPETLKQLSSAAGAYGTCLFTTNFKQVSNWVCSTEVNSLFKDWLAEGWPTRAERPRRLVASNHAGFVTELDVFTLEELEHDVEHNEFLKPRGFGLSSGTFIPMPSGDVVVYSIETRLGQPALDNATIARLNALRPHLARSGALAVRLGLERARAAAEAFEIIGLPTAALGVRGQLLAANNLFAKLIPATFADFKSRVRINNVAADNLLPNAIRSGAWNAVASIPLPAANDAPPYVIHLLPIKKQAHDIFSSVTWLCVAVPVVPAEVAGAEVLQGLFDLSPAEAKVARAVAAAKTIDALSQSLKLSKETIRSQLKAVFAKTGVTRQAELVALLSGSDIANER